MDRRTNQVLIYTLQNKIIKFSTFIGKLDGVNDEISQAFTLSIRHTKFILHKPSGSELLFYEIEYWIFFLG